MRKFTITMCIIITPWVCAKEQEETFVCMTDIGEYEYQIKGGTSKKIALNSEEEVMVPVDTGQVNHNQIASKKHIKAVESTCNNYAQQTPLAAGGKRMSSVFFELNSFALRTQEKKQLNQLVVRFREQLRPIRVEGHTDSSGSTVANKTLALKRANAVKEYLVRRGYQANLITVFTAGQSSPKYSNKTKDGRKKNRRVEIQI
ncbi:putative OmpA-like domain-containing protein [Vibrio owensii]|uniref:OmpA-like domain-containing protein n=1 Tax=Vibrio owensii TaxID=696485 RepID=A0AAU9Q9Q3_9VIBR|nr:putative OmpA-like domain-containing protein [Vibrio owensii]